ncbi:MAG: ATP-binding protein [Pseudomonadales bacterium]|nr:ATP-binding protein [Pseudomonadales bacterium]
MGRLFWKFFFAFWLSVVVAGLGVGGTVWLRHQAAAENKATDTHTYRIPPNQALLLDIAGELYANEEIETLKLLLQKVDKRGREKLYAVKETGEELLGRDTERFKPLPISAKEITNQSHDRLFLFFEDRWPPKGEPPMFVKPPDKDLGPPPNNGAHRGPGDKPPPRPLMFLISIGLICSVTLSFLMAWYFSKPIRNLRHAFLSMAEGNLDTRVSPDMGTRHDEFAELGEKFDFMAGRLKGLIKTQEQLLHDVSHELRSPLARIQAAIGLAQQQPQKMPEMFSRVNRESKRINELVEELLFLARFDSGRRDIALFELDLVDVINDVVDDAAFENHKKDIETNIDQNDHILMPGNAELLHRAIENVVRNALRFSQTKVKIDVSFEDAGSSQSWVVIKISDDGKGINEEHLHKIFQPFFKSHQQQRVDGIGLGLTIASRAIDFHSGTIAARNLYGNDSKHALGLEIEMKIPRHS